MKADHFINIIKGYLVMVAAILVGVSVITVIDVQVALSQIDAGESRTWPHMSPQICYYFIPVIAAVAAIGSMMVNLVLGLIQRRHLVQMIHWAFLGGAYSLVLVAFPVTRVGVNGFAALIFSVISSFLAVLLIRWRYGVSQSRAAVSQTMQATHEPRA